MVERRSPKPIVVGSNPTGPATYFNSTHFKVSMTESNLDQNSEGQGGNPGSTVSFFRSVLDELRLVTWPERSHVIKSSLIVVVFCIAVTVVVGILDYLLTVMMVFLNRVL